MAKDNSARRGAANPTDKAMTEKQSSKRRAQEPRVDDKGHNVYHSAPSTPPFFSEGVTPDDNNLPDYKDALASVADRYLAKSSEPQTQPAPDPPQSDSQTPDKSSEVPPVSPSPKPQAGRARRLDSGQWVTP